MKSNPYFTLVTKMNLKYIKSLNIRPQTITLLEEIIEKCPLTWVLAMILGYDTKIASMKAKVNKQNK